MDWLNYKKNPLIVAVIAGLVGGFFGQMIMPDRRPAKEAPKEKTTTIIGERFVLVDTKGKMRAVWATGNTGPFIAFYHDGDESRPATIVGFGPGGMPAVMVSDKTKDAGAMMGVIGDTANIAVMGKKGEPVWQAVK